MVRGEKLMGEEQQWYWEDEYKTIVKDEWDEAFYNTKTTYNDIITFNSGAGENSEMLRIAQDGFYVRGVKVDADAKEAEQVYTAFKQWLMWNTLATK
jgi:hypothetical protein